MSKWRVCMAAMIAAACLSVATGSYGQVIGLQIADTAEPHAPGEFVLTLGGLVSSDAMFLGIRQSYGLFPALRVFLDMGVSDTADEDADLAAQGGALYALPIEFVSDLALRAAVYGLNADSRDLFGFNVALLSSGETMLRDLYVYAAAGLDVAKEEATRLGHLTSTDTRVNPLVAVGLLYNVTDSLSVYGEVGYVEDLCFGIGLRIR